MRTKYLVLACMFSILTAVHAAYAAQPVSGNRPASAAQPTCSERPAPGAQPASVAQQGGERHRAAPIGSYGGLMNPDVSAILNTKCLFTDNRENPQRDKLFIEEAELAFQSYLYPGIRGDFIVAMHQHEGEWVIHPEEAYVSFLDLPFGFQLLAGRKLAGFGRLNPVHPHHWKFAGYPLVFQNFFGDHAWFDDGAEIDWLVPNPWDAYCRVAFGAWSGETIGHHAHQDETEDLSHHHTLAWRGKSFNARASIDIPLGELSNGAVGYSAAWDEGFHTVLHGVDAAITYRRPMSYNRVRLQAELFAADVEDEGMRDPIGLYAMLSATLNQYWEFGARYDRSEFFRETAHDGEDGEDGIVNEQDWGAAVFVSYYFTHSMYVRPEYRHVADRFDRSENQFVVQLVWGLGPHAHRLED